MSRTVPFLDAVCDATSPGLISTAIRRQVLTTIVAAANFSGEQQRTVGVISSIYRPEVLAGDLDRRIGGAAEIDPDAKPTLMCCGAKPMPKCVS
jgi:hypothetical protein